MKKIQRLVFLGLAYLLSAAVFGYIALWVFIAWNIRAEVIRFIANAMENKVTFEGKPPSVSGFPFSHKLSYSGTIRYSPFSIDLPALEIEGFFPPGHDVVIRLPKGGKAQGPGFDGAIWSVDFLSLEGPLPQTLPTGLTIEDLQIWRGAGGAVKIERLKIRKDRLDVEGSGTLTLDERLQPAGDLTIHVTGHMQFMAWMAQNKLIETKQALLAGTVMAGFAKYDEKTGDPYLDGNLSLQNQTLFLGPLRLTDMPDVRWPWRTQIPAPVQP